MTVNSLFLSCNLTLFEFDQSSENGECINWNRYYTTCKSAGATNPFQGAVSFDNIGFAWVAIFLVRSLSKQSYLSMILSGHLPGGLDRHHVLRPGRPLILELDLLCSAHRGMLPEFWYLRKEFGSQIGAFFMINLCLVVIATQFAETKRRETERMIQERKRMRSAGSICEFILN